ncbi:peptidylprolyl isomerase [Paenibacillus terrigena]|uniref:peptidylprolyl isomerase n=1 Tax=Paenibacillus terrigena TaxID=369333 RepID=UPI0028D42FF2|nr:peptidylprolyl isomerase [Paenibacillus terrigena]
MEKGLWVSVTVLVGCVVILSCIILLRLSASETKQQEGPDASSQREDSLSSSSVIARLGGDSITEGQMQHELSRKYGVQMLQDMLKEKAVDQEAALLGIEVTPAEMDQELKRVVAGYEDEEAYYKLMLEQAGLTRAGVRDDIHRQLLMDKIMVAYANVREDEINDYISANPKVFHAPEQLNISQIMVDTKKEAEEILGQLADHADFATLAEQYSMDVFSSDQGGELGLIDVDDPFTDPVILASAKRLEVGQVDGPVKLKQGYAIIQLNGRIAARSMSDEESHIVARKEIAHTKGKSSQEIEQDLLEKYGAEVLDSKYLAIQ